MVQVREDDEEAGSHTFCDQEIVKHGMRPLTTLDDADDFS